MVRRMVLIRSDVHMLAVFYLDLSRQLYSLLVSKTNTNIDWDITNMPIPFKKKITELGKYVILYGCREQRNVTAMLRTGWAAWVRAI